MVRLTPVLVKKIDVYRKHLEQKMGLPVTRTGAVRALLTEALRKYGRA